MTEEWVSPAQSAYTVECISEGCMNKNIRIVITADAENPSVQCGPCGQMITNITPT